jgi:hypothetical protein
LDDTFAVFESEVFAEDVAVPCAEFAADGGFACGFTVGEFGLFFGVNCMRRRLVWETPLG